MHYFLLPQVIYSGASSTPAFSPLLGSDESKRHQENGIYFLLCLTLLYVSGEGTQPGHKPRICHFVYLKCKASHWHCIKRFFICGKIVWDLLGETMLISPFLSSNPLHLSTPCQRHACQCVNQKSQVYLYIFVCHSLNNITHHTIFQARDKPNSMTLSKCFSNEKKTSWYCTRKPLYCQML